MNNNLSSREATLEELIDDYFSNYSFDDEEIIEEDTENKGAEDETIQEEVKTLEEIEIEKYQGMTRAEFEEEFLDF